MVAFSSYFISSLESTENGDHKSSKLGALFQPQDQPLPKVVHGPISSHMTHIFHNVPKFLKIFIYLLNAYYNTIVIFS